MKPKKIPTRLCLGCRQTKPKRELIRVVRNNHGEIFLDTTGKKSGRGAYICHDKDCFDIARKAKRFEKSLGVKIDDDIYRKLEEELYQSGQ